MLVLPMSEDPEKCRTNDSRSRLANAARAYTGYPAAPQGQLRPYTHELSQIGQ